eukprot:gene2228-gene1825
MLSLTQRPHTTARCTLRKLSSSSTISADFTATSVPLRITNPTFASLSAGASFVPSPVTATTSPRSINMSTSSCLSRGCERPMTVMRLRIAANFSIRASSP